jgi:hypothetical protein
VLVAAVLRPQDREDRELEVVRRPSEQLSDTVELPVGETERSMERLGNRGQEASLAPASDVAVAAVCGGSFRPGSGCRGFGSRFR